MFWPDATTRWVGEGWVEWTELDGTLPGANPQVQGSTQARTAARTPRSNEIEERASVSWSEQPGDGWKGVGMARLVHLNGPPAIGKSTLSGLYVDRNPGVLNLDIDIVHRLVGGWQDEETDTWPAVWSLVRAMASTHLKGGHDVVLPQFMGTARGALRARASRPQARGRLP